MCEKIERKRLLKYLLEANTPLLDPTTLDLDKLNIESDWKSVFVIGIDATVSLNSPQPLTLLTSPKLSADAGLTHG